MARRVAIPIAAMAFVLAACTGGPSELTSSAGASDPAPTDGPAASETAPGDSAVFAPAGLLEPGTRYDLTLNLMPATFSVPTAHWISNGSFLLDGYGGSPDQAQMFFWPDAVPVGVFADPCAGEADPPVGPSAADLAAAVAAVPGTELLNGPSDITVDGYAGQFVELRVPDDIGCRPNSFLLWYAALARWGCADEAECARYASWPDSTIRVWIIEVNGARAFIEAETRYPDASEEVDQEFHQIVNSIDFD